MDLSQSWLYQNKKWRIQDKNTPIMNRSTNQKSRVYSSDVILGNESYKNHNYVNIL